MVQKKYQIEKNYPVIPIPRSLLFFFFFLQKIWDQIMARFYLILAGPGGNEHPTKKLLSCMMRHGSNFGPLGPAASFN